MVVEVRIEELKQTLRSFANGFVEYENPSIREKEENGVWEYEVLSDEFAWHDESNHDNIGFAISSHQLKPSPGYSPVYPSDGWLCRFAAWFRGLSCQINAYKPDHSDDGCCFLEFVIMLEGLEEWDSPLWVEVFYSNGRW